MRRDHGLAGLIAPLVVSGLAGAVALAGWLGPQVADAPQPLFGDRFAGWALLAAGVAAAWRGRAPVGLLLLAAGAGWVAVGLAGLLPTPWEEPVLRLGLLPGGLLVLAVLGELSAAARATSAAPLDSAAWGRWGWGRWAPGLVVVPVAVAAVGYGRWAYVAMGATGVAYALAVLRERSVPRHRAVLRRPVRDTLRGTAAVAVGVCGAVAVAGLVTAGVGGAPATTASATLEAVLGFGALVLAAGPEPREVRPRLSGVAPHGLEEALARTLGWTKVQVAFPLGGAFVDSGGSVTSPPADGEEVADHEGRVVAVLAPGLGRDPGVADSVREVLLLARRGALLQAELRDRAGELAASRERLVRAAEAERERFVASLARGPVARMDRVVAALDGVGRREPGIPEGLGGLSARAAGARDELLRVAHGVDPVGGTSLADALATLVARSGTGARLSCHLPEDWRPRPSVSRAAWFTCAEGLANATKHAPGARVVVSALLTGDELRLVVRDDGPGGVDLAGHGLGGLVERATALGGTLTARSGATGGAELELRLPVAPDDAPAQPGDVAPARSTSSAPGAMTGAVVLLGLCCALVLSACAGPPARTGRAADPVVLRTMYGNGPGGVGADLLEEVVRASAGTSVVLGAATQLPTAAASEDEEGGTLDALRAGRSDLSVIRADRLAGAGALSLSPLQLPLLIQAPEHAVRVAADPVATDLMADLDRIGVVGLALVPGGARHPFTHGAKAFTAPTDYRGAVVNTRVGPGVQAIVTALGATTDHSVGEVRTRKVERHEVAGIETSFQQPGAVTLPAVAVSNLTLYTKFDVVVVRRSAYDALSAEQRRRLDGIVRDGIRAGLARRDSEARGLQRWCSSPSAASVQLTPGQLRAFGVALAPVVTAARRDARVASLVDRIEALRGSEPSPAGTTCDNLHPASTDVFSLAPVGPQTVLDGTWRVDADPDVMRAAGVSDADAASNAGVWTFVVKNGEAVVDQAHGPDCTAQFVTAGERVTLRFGVDGNTSCWGLMAGTFRREGDVVSFDWQAERFYDLTLDRAFFAGGMHRVAR
jgi:TRAP-type C4-dicarboxylate transport system substrate-binding protein